MLFSLIALHGQATQNDVWVHIALELKGIDIQSQKYQQIICEVCDMHTFED